MKASSFAAIFVPLIFITSNCLGQDNPASTRDPADAPAANSSYEIKLSPDAVEDPEIVIASADAWRVEVNTWMWLMGIEGDIGVRGLKSNVSASFGDVLDASDSLFAFSGRLELGKGRWGGFFEGVYANIGVDDTSGPLGFASIDVEFELTLLDFGVMYRLGDWVAEGASTESRRRTTLDLYAGGRYTDIDLKLDPANADTRAGSRDWIDPIVGAKLVHPFAESWHLRVNGDIGGFGVGSDFTWPASGVVGYDFTVFGMPANVYAGYRAIGQDYTDGSGSDKFTWDVILHGPVLGFALRF